MTGVLWEFTRGSENIFLCPIVLRISVTPYFGVNVGALSMVAVYKTH